MSVLPSYPTGHSSVTLHISPEGVYRLLGSFFLPSFCETRAVTRVTCYSFGSLRLLSHSFRTGSERSDCLFPYFGINRLQSGSRSVKSLRVLPSVGHSQDADVNSRVSGSIVVNEPFLSTQFRVLLLFTTGFCPFSSVWGLQK